MIQQQASSSIGQVKAKQKESQSQTKQHKKEMISKLAAALYAGGFRSTYCSAKRLMKGTCGHLTGHRCPRGYTLNPAPR